MQPKNYDYYMSHTQEIVFHTRTNENLIEREEFVVLKPDIFIIERSSVKTHKTDLYVEVA